MSDDQIAQPGVDLPAEPPVEQIADPPVDPLGDIPPELLTDNGARIAADGEYEPITPPPYCPPPGGRHIPAEIYEHRVAVAGALRMEGYSAPEIAKILQLTEGQVRWALRRARMEGRINDVIADMDHELVPRAVENVLKGLEAGDKEYTLKVLAGRGVLRNHTQNKNEGAGQMQALVVQFTTPTGAPPPTVVNIQTLSGQVVGAPRAADEGEDHAGHQGHDGRVESGQPALGQ